MNYPAYIYKCRLCGLQFESMYGGDPVGALSYAMAGKESPSKGFHVKLHEFHNCEDGSIGISDLQGAKEKK